MKCPRIILLLAALAAAGGAAAQTSVNVSVGGVIAPGVYGRVDISNGPPPPVVYPQPVIIAPPPVAVLQQRAPIYLAVPPGHAKHWAKHCAKYGACNQPVYFVRTAEYEPGYRGKGHRHDRDDDHDRGRRGREDRD